MARQQSSFHLLGFPVTITPGFVLGMLILLAINQADPAFGIRLVVAIAAFTLIHELGHAVAARRFDADAAISLNFLVGYAIYRPRRPMTRAEQATISVAGPAVQIAIGTALLLALGANPLSYATIRGDALLMALWWAGPMLGAINLVPVLPLDGGNILALGVDRIVPGRGHRIVQWFSVALCAVAMVLVITDERWRPWAITVGLFAFWALQGVLPDRRRGRPGDATTQQLWAVAREAEQQGWESGGNAGLFPPGYGPSPWLRAAVLQRAGKDATARALLVQSLERDSGAWVPPVAATATQLAPLVALLPDEPPVDDARGASVLLQVLHRAGLLAQEAHYGARLYAEHPSAGVGHQVARALALMGEPALAVGWLRSAHVGGGDAGALDDPELASLRGRPDFEALRVEMADRRRDA